MLECCRLRKSFGTRKAVDGLSFAVSAGEIYGLLGPNGAGKTTTISIICGLLDADSGTATVAGEPMSRRAVAARENVGYVPQEIALWEDLSARENLEFFGRLYGLRGRRLRSRVTEALDSVLLGDRADERLGQYSGGMKRRANIAAGLLHKPLLLILDEPTVGVDPNARHATLELISSLAAGGLAVLFASHYLGEVQRICNRVGIVDEGRMISEGTVDELVRDAEEGQQVELSTPGSAEQLAKLCTTVQEVQSVLTDEGVVRLRVTSLETFLPRLLAAASGAGVAISGMRIVEPDLEDVFLQLTGKRVREE